MDKSANNEENKKNIEKTDKGFKRGSILINSIKFHT